ncbi:sperm-tail PG-rich repeat-containing protein 2 [Xylocopa sonorina]|uniref:sperm-tail PG-rich repeat-containing protein 2 n=1 Tax=Xylocopa sonorina TaxID=1818115 RepID=UPI00403A9D52
MAYDKTKRFPKLISQTSAEIGPGTYNVSDLPCPKRHLAEFSPFLCGSKRKTIIVSKDAEQLPGPGSYNIKQPQRHIPERVSIDFTDARFKGEISEGPGPVDYQVASDVIKCGKIRSHPGTWRGPAGKDTNTTTLMYKGNFWSRMTGRTERRRFLTPGPGDYQHERKKTASQIQDEKIREERRMSSRQPRFLDTFYRRKMRERFDDKIQSDIPGPGTYEPPKPIKCTASIYPAPFGVCSGRFKKDPGDKRPG